MQWTLTKHRWNVASNIALRLNGNNSITQILRRIVRMLFYIQFDDRHVTNDFPFPQNYTLYCFIFWTIAQIKKKYYAYKLHNFYVSIRLGNLLSFPFC